MTRHLRCLFIPSSLRACPDVWVCPSRALCWLCILPSATETLSVGVMLTVLSFGLVPQSASVRLDPLTLIASKGAQTSTRRPYCPPAQNSGLQTATLALG